MVQISNEEYKKLVAAYSDIEKIRFLLTLQKTIGLSVSELIPEINAVVNPPRRIPVIDPEEGELY